jgi:uncharacterized protein YcaQ
MSDEWKSQITSHLLSVDKRDTCIQTVRDRSSTVRQSAQNVHNQLMRINQRMACMRQALATDSKHNPWWCQQGKKSKLECIFDIFFIVC